MRICVMTVKEEKQKVIINCFGQNVKLRSTYEEELAPIAWLLFIQELKTRKQFWKHLWKHETVRQAVISELGICYCETLILT